ncbi:MAG TPA: polysaccharide deacetylase family protein [Gemmatimonadaceae bacterium]|jgi:peptidoglycan/xylan/chitin deacetylase (PgdA/CDA1 family)|nr:polysaccharide deacetylase family protein [Gemmatimonadaceae bacterium]
MIVPPILCYHKVDRRGDLGVTRLSPRRFATQLERLAAGGWRTLSLEDVERCLTENRPLGRREFVITFDDAYRSLREHAFPALTGVGYTAICAVITDYAGRLNRWDVAYGGRRFAHLAWRDMRHWQSRGVEFISHTATHPRLTWLAPREAADEMSRSRRALRESLDVEARAIAYPFGAARQRERTLATAAGYSMGFTLATAWRGDPLAVPRLPVYIWTREVPVAGPAEWLVAAAANRCAVGTSIFQRFTRSTGK